MNLNQQVATSNYDSHPSRPGTLEMLGELRAPLEMAFFWMRAPFHQWPHAARGQNKLIMVIPGFTAGDVTLIPLARLCEWLGHRVFPSGILSNSRCPRETLDALEERLARISDLHQGRVVLIGQSLGGIYARALARRVPDLVERAITLGAPINRPLESCNPAVTRVADAVRVVRGKGDGCFTESCSCGVSIPELPGEEKVPITVIYSHSDGVAHWESCVDRSGSPLVENIEVPGSHCGMGVNYDVLAIVAERLAEPSRTPELLVHARRDAGARISPLQARP